MPDISLTGQDTVQIDGNIIFDLADGTPFDITFPNDYATIKIGKNGNSIYAKNAMGVLVDVSLRVLLGQVTDKYLTGRMAEWDADESTFTLLTAMFVKRVGDGLGNIESKIYNMIGGVFKRGVAAKTVAEGDTEQSVAIYQMQFVCPPPSVQG